MRRKINHVALITLLVDLFVLILDYSNIEFIGYTILGVLIPLMIFLILIANNYYQINVHDEIIVALWCLAVVGAYFILSNTNLIDKNIIIENTSWAGDGSFWAIDITLHHSIYTFIGSFIVIYLLALIAMRIGHKIWQKVK